MKTRREKEYFTLSAEVRTEFLKHIDDNNINKSKLIENLIEEYLRKYKERV
jgi:hypothetical protein